ncbi:hypothetical protein ACFP9V_25055 [Deinococcus radiopugnans]|uniref:Uncharacterized protein n=1 Tax=Deinococcus radiopugnans ATCC 19172 TaxID=585398 RepID=A0A5C4XLI8_9DEIO|nr:hypothetical protein [Deinococcus radiopugnans]MBB6018750.1 hypothetical protein [Deinococcus radiopugnans ATCC 19172]TNM64376.1 hypothetical protein FHR04_19760 [Deinococcus radiopugnans ATCC 19172]
MNHPLKRGLLSILLLLTACAPTASASNDDVTRSSRDFTQTTVFAPGQIWTLGWGDWEHEREDTFTVPALTAAENGHQSYVTTLESGDTVSFEQQFGTETSAYLRVRLDSKTEGTHSCIVGMSRDINPKLVLGGIYGMTFDDAADALFLKTDHSAGRRSCVLIPKNKN